MSDKQAHNTVYDALNEAANAHLERTALIYEGIRVTYSDLLTNVDNTVRHLRSLDIHQGDIFSIFGQNTLEHFYCYYAASKMGAIIVSMNPNLTAGELGYAFEHSGSKVLFFDPNVESVARDAVPSEKLISVESLKSVAWGDDHIQKNVDPSDDFILSYSSGTTGTPKAVMMDHLSQVNATKSASNMWRTSDQDVALVGLPLGYLYGLTTASASVLHSGGTLVVLRRFHPREALEAFVHYSVTLFAGVPAMYSMMIAYCEQNNLYFDLTHTRRLISAGAPLPDETISRFREKFGVSIQNYYGLTESFPIFGHYEDDTSHSPSGTIGKLAPGATVLILNQDGSECDIGEAGEAYVRGPGTMKEYFKAPDMTTGAMIDGLFKTGDLVSKDKNGFFYIRGRIKDIIIHGGHNISPSEVERVLMNHVSVQDAAVVGISDSVFGENPVAFITLRHGQSVSEQDLMIHVEKELSDFKVPKRIIFYNELPLGKTGKVDKLLLKRFAESQS